VKTPDNERLHTLGYIFGLLFFLLLCRIVYLQVFQKDFLCKISKSQYYKLLPIDGRRGSILDRKGRVLATSLSCYSVFVDPVMVKNREVAAAQLSTLLNISYDRILIKLQRGNRFVWLKRKISFEEKQKIKALKIGGIGFMREEKRFYPQEETGSTLLGIVDVDNKGLDGLELYYDQYLRGKKGFTTVLRDSALRNVLLNPGVMAPEAGGDLVLTIDSQIQYWADSSLQEIVKQYGAKGGNVVVMNALTGEVLAVSNYPLFNPNLRETINRDAMRNKAVCDVFEPGSVFKMITLCAALDKKAFSEEDKVFCENGQYKIPGATLHDYHPYGTLTFAGVFEKSSNIGVGKINERLGKATIYDYIKRFGFGAKTGVDLPGEVGGMLKPLNRWSNTSVYMVPIGQEIGVNLMQLVRAFAAVANGGYLVKPYVMKKVVFSSSVKSVEGSKLQILSAETTNRAQKVLEMVVGTGTGVKAQIEGFQVGGKTGTAQKFDVSTGRYSPDRYRASFIGFVMSDPPIVIGATVDEPTKSHFGGVIAAPLFKMVAEKTVKYLVGENAKTIN
jgi:cell division protein FtsI (penicillin-binding protein 3)